MINTICNTTLEDLRITPGSEIAIVGDWTFHTLALTVGGGGSIIAILASFFLMFQHATHYTKPREQKHIIRILLMVPIYSVASWLSIKYYWHYIYFDVLANCYEAFAISSFFALLCHYIAPDIHEQKEFFRLMNPIQPWVWPVNWFAKCCGGQRGPWRTPKSGLTWFNINWIGIYHYCFIRVTMTITAVGTQYFERYCESSNSPVFAHIWVLVIESLAVTIAMYCVIQFYVQLREPLKEQKPFLKVLSIKLVIFLSFWQSTAISVGTSTLDFLQPNSVLAYPDIKVGIPSLLLCVEMACFAILHLWAFPWRPYADNAKPTYYPVPDPSMDVTPRENEHGPKQGGFLGIKAFWDAANVWDIVKAFGRGIRWLFVGVKHRKEDVSYQVPPRKASDAAAADGMGMDMDMDDLGTRQDTSYHGASGGAIVEAKMGPGMKSTDHLPIASEFRRSTFVTNHLGTGPAQTQTDGSPGPYTPYRGNGPKVSRHDESQGLIDHAQPNPSSPYESSPPYDGHGSPLQPLPEHPYDAYGVPGRQSLSTVEEESYVASRHQSRHDMYSQMTNASSGSTEFGGERQQQSNRTSTQLRIGQALWGTGPYQGGQPYQGQGGQPYQGQGGHPYQGGQAF